MAVWSRGWPGSGAWVVVGRQRLAARAEHGPIGKTHESIDKARVMGAERSKLGWVERDGIEKERGKTSSVPAMEFARLGAAPAVPASEKDRLW